MNRKSCIIGFIIGLLSSGGIGAIAYQQLTLEMNIEFEIPERTSIRIVGRSTGHRSDTYPEIINNSYYVDLGVMSQVESRTSFRILNEGSQDTDVIWNVRGDIGYVDIRIEYDPNGNDRDRTVWEMGEPATIIRGQNFNVFVTITDLGLSVGSHKLKLTFEVV